MPGAVEGAAATVIVEVPLPVIVLGPKVTVTPAGWPVADKVIDGLNPPVAVLVMVVLVELPSSTQKNAGEADRLNPWVNALIRLLPLGLPQPVVRSYPTVAQNPPSWQPLVTS